MKCLEKWQLQQLQEASRDESCDLKLLISCFRIPIDGTYSLFKLISLMSRN